MKLQLPSSYKLVLSLAVVIGPIIWLMFTEDGKRRSDLVLLHLLGDPSFDIAYEKLSPAVTEALIGEQFPKVDFQCQTITSNLGDRLCAAEIASFNALPARAAQLTYAGQQLRVLQLNYRLAYHDLLTHQLRDSLGAPREQSTAQRPVLIWSLEGGQLMLPAAPPEHPGDAALIWLAHPVG